MIPEIADANTELAIAALGCGLTNVVTIAYVHGRGTYAFLRDRPGVEPDSWGLDKHDNHHRGHARMLVEIDRWQATHLARIVAALKALPEGQGSVWDRTMIVWINSGGGKHHFGERDHPLVVIGNPGSRLRSGRYVSFPRGTRCLSDAYVTVARALGVGIDTFGDETVCAGALPEILVQRGGVNRP